MTDQPSAQIPSDPGASPWAAPGPMPAQPAYQAGPPTDPAPAQYATAGYPSPAHAGTGPQQGSFLSQGSDLAIPPPPAPEYDPAVAATGRQWPYASWGARVAAFLIDALLACVGAIPWAIGLAVLGASASTSAFDPANPYVPQDTIDPGMAALAGLLMLAGGVLSLAIQLWNRVFRMGRTGQSVGKGVMNLYLVDRSTGNPIGAGMCFVREIAHILDQIPLYVGYLWPLWDPQRQTFADKVVGTVVAQAPSGRV